MEIAVIVLIAVLAFAVVLYPLFRRSAHGNGEREFGTGEVSALAAVGAGAQVPFADGAAAQDVGAPADEIEREVLRYRAAVRAGTVCRKCGQANPADSKFCFECGAQLARADAKEFE